MNKLTKKELDDYKKELPPSLVDNKTDKELEMDYIKDIVQNIKCEALINPLLQDLQSNGVISKYEWSKEQDKYKVKIEVVKTIEEDEDYQDTAMRIENMLECITNSNIYLIYNGKVLK